MVIEVPAKLAACHDKFYGNKGKEWIAQLPGLAEDYLNKWQLSLDGPAMHGMVGLVLPVRQADGVPAALKLQPIDAEHLGEATALRVWQGQGTALLLNEEEHASTSILLLERLQGDRSLIDLPDIDDAVRIISELLIRLHAHKAPPEIRKLDYIVDHMLADVAEVELPNADESQLLRAWADRVADLPRGDDRLLHWDLHYENVLAAEREPWLGIDPKPLAGNPGFDLMPALHNRWEEAAATGNVGRAIRRRHDQMTEILGLDRDLAAGWTVARALQNCLWGVEDGETTLDPIQVAIAEALTQTRH